MEKLRIVTSGVSGGRWVHAAVSRRPPISLYAIAARSHVFTYGASVWDKTLVQGPFSVAPFLCRTQTIPIRNFCVACKLVASRGLGLRPPRILPSRGKGPGVEVRGVWVRLLPSACDMLSIRPQLKRP